MSISNADIQILRRLAHEYMECATLPVQKQKRDLWRALNRSQMVRPMVNIDQIPWGEFASAPELACRIADPFWRDYEEGLRRLLYRWNNFPADMVLEPFLTIPAAISNSRYGMRPSEETLTDENASAVSSHLYHNQIKDFDDIEKIKDMQITLNKEETRERLQVAGHIFDGIPLVSGHGVGFHIGVWDALSMYMGIEDIYFDIIDRPEFIHALMDRITNSALSGIEQANALGLHDDIASTCHCSYIYTGQLLPDFGAGRGPVSKNCWAFGMAQLFASASPATTEEFELPYVSKMAEKFGMVYYGCCEGLDDRLDIVKRIPNVKKVSCSPWSNRKNFAEKIGDELVMSNKPTPAYLAVDSLEPEIIKADLEQTIQLAKANNVNLEFILKDISTVRNQPGRIGEWERIAMALVESW